MNIMSHHRKGLTVKPTEQIAKFVPTPKTVFAMLSNVLHTQRTGAPSPTPLLATLATIGATVLASAGLTATLPTSASAYATTEGPPIYSTATGLPDGRIYEQVSPTDANGNEAGAGTGAVIPPFGAAVRYSVAAASGNAVLFEATGALGEAPDSYLPYYVATKNVSGSECPDSGGSPNSGWCTRALLPRAQQPFSELQGSLYVSLIGVDPSPDLSHVMFRADLGTYAAGMPSECEPTPEVEPGNRLDEDASQLYLSGPDPFVPATWLERPEMISNPVVNCHGEPGEEGTGASLVGGTPDFSTVYFAYAGTLLPADAPRAPHAGTGANVESWGFYEDHEGELREADTLPADSPYPGEPDPFGALPAAATPREGNEVSADGTRAFFVSPDPASCAANNGHNNCTLDPPELYVREHGGRTQLVSRDALLPAVGGLPAPAPAVSGAEASTASFSFASPDGSQAFFQSEDKLTEDAPANTALKTYDFDLDTGALTYLPNVVGKIVATDTEGTSFAFVRPEAGGEPAELDLWSGPGAGRVTPITQIPGAELTGGNSVPVSRVGVARMSSDGSAVVFTSAYRLPGAFNNAELVEEGVNAEDIYRYDASSNTLACVSCAPAGVTPTGAVMSHLHELGTRGGLYLTFGANVGLVEPRGISSDGDRVFFETSARLVPQDVNSGSSVTGFHGEVEPQGRNVYEWENGVVYLISSGKSPRNSYFLDNSANGDDVFFATTDALTPGHTDGGYAVYDARVPQPGDTQPPAAVPCEGSVCQGPPNVQSPLAPPARATFSGSDNLIPEPTVTPPPPKKTTKKTVKCAKGKKLTHGKCVKKYKPKKAKKSPRGSK
jgi:hypothetical protein